MVNKRLTTEIVRFSDFLRCQINSQLTTKVQAWAYVVRRIQWV